MKRPICPICKFECSPSGGTIGGSEKDIEHRWTCWDCKYHVWDIHAEEIKPAQLEGIKPDNTP